MRMEINSGRKASFLWPRKISLRDRTVLISALIFGLAAHGMAMTNKFSHHDDILALFTQGTTLTSGRWMLHLMGWLEDLIFGDGHYSLPLFNGLISLLCVAGAALLIVRMMRIENLFYCAGLTCVMAAFPAMTAYFAFVYTIHYYLISMLMTVLAAYLLCEVRKWWAVIPAAILGGSAVGVYQAYFPMILSLILLYDMMMLSERNEKPAVFWKDVLRQVLGVLAVMAFYFVMNRFFLNRYNLELSDYKGVNQVGSTSLAVYLNRALAGWREFFLPARDVSRDMYPQHLYYVYLIMVALDAVLGLRLVFRTWKERRGKALLLLVLLVLFPLAVNFIFVMCEDVHGLMTYGQTVQVALFIWLLDRLWSEGAGWNWKRLASLAAALVLALMGVMDIRFANQCYLKAEFQQQQAITWYSTLITRIKSAEGYRDEYPVAVINSENKQDESLYNIDELDFIYLNTYGEPVQEYINSYTWRQFMERWCGYGPAYVSPKKFLDRPEVQDMPSYPDDGSIRVIDGTVVVKF